MQNLNFVGIDVSKLTLDVWVKQTKKHKRFSNDVNGFRRMIKWLSGENTRLEFCLEHTGVYAYDLCQFLEENEFTYYLISGLAVKRSLGITRGKNDKVDAKALARYLDLFRKELSPYQLPSAAIRELKQLLTLRKKLVKDRASFKVKISETAKYVDASMNKFHRQTLMDLIEVLDVKIKEVEKRLDQIIEDHHELKQTYHKITKIKGVGKILSLNMIVTTNNFKSFKNWRKYAAYAGTAPFEHSSGTSYKGKTKVSHLANKQMKSLLSNAASTAVLHCPEMKQYYKRRLESGKSKMSTINMIRNKLISRIFAVARREEPYVQIQKFAA